MPAYPPPGASSQSLPPQQRTQFFLSVLIGICVLFAASYVGRILDQIHMDGEIARQRMANEMAEKKLWELRAYLEYVQSDAYVEETAREELGMSEPGDHRVVVLPAAGAPPPAQPAAPVIFTSAPVAGPLPTAVPERVEGSVWEQWLRLLR